MSNRLIYGFGNALTVGACPAGDLGPIEIDLMQIQAYRLQGRLLQSEYQPNQEKTH